MGRALGLRVRVGAREARWDDGYEHDTHGGMLRPVHTPIEQQLIFLAPSTYVCEVSSILVRAKGVYRLAGASFPTIDDGINEDVRRSRPLLAHALYLKGSESEICPTQIKHQPYSISVRPWLL
jgi:hypothetical protein